jgi:iron complex outermembrane receptor protein
MEPRASLALVTVHPPLWSGLTLLLLVAPSLWAQEPPDAPPAKPPGDEPIELAEEITVTAGHGDRRSQDVPLRIEVVDREEIEEKALMTPGSVAMLLGETTGPRVQTTAPSTGAANVRIQGLRGRYALLLSDGLPL